MMVRSMLVEMFDIYSYSYLLFTITICLLFNVYGISIYNNQYNRHNKSTTDGRITKIPFPAHPSPQTINPFPDILLKNNNNLR